MYECRAWFNAHVHRPTRTVLMSRPEPTGSWIELCISDLQAIEKTKTTSVYVWFIYYVSMFVMHGLCFKDTFVSIKNLCQQGIQCLYNIQCVIEWVRKVSIKCAMQICEFYNRYSLDASCQLYHSLLLKYKDRSFIIELMICFRTGKSPKPFAHEYDAADTEGYIGPAGRSTPTYLS